MIKSISDSNFNYTKAFDSVVLLYSKSKLLLESNDLVSYDHFFSNEFKIGLFVPIMLPIVYGLAKTLKTIIKK